MRVDLSIRRDRGECTKTIFKCWIAHRLQTLMHGVIRSTPSDTAIIHSKDSGRIFFLGGSLFDVFDIVGPPRSRPQTGTTLKVSLPVDQLLPLNLSNATTKVPAQRPKSHPTVLTSECMLLSKSTPTDSRTMLAVHFFLSD